MKNNIKNLLFIAALLAFAGCSAGRDQVKRQVALQSYRTIAFAAFDSPAPALGEKTSDRFARKFSNKGYKSLDRNRLNEMVDGEVKTPADLAKYRADLEKSGIRAVVFGAITKYECKGRKVWSWTGFAPEKTGLNDCRAALTVRMVDVDSEEVVWESSGAHFESTGEMTARVVLEIAITKIEDDIPPLKQ